MTDTQKKPEEKEEKTVQQKEEIETDNYTPLELAVKKHHVDTNWKAVWETSFGEFLKEASQQNNAADMAEKIFMGLLFASIIFPMKIIEETLKAKQESLKKTQQDYQASLKNGLARSNKTPELLAHELIRQASLTFRAIASKQTHSSPEAQKIATFVKTLPLTADGYLNIPAFSKRQKARFNKLMYDYAIHSKRFHDTLGTASGIEFSLAEKKRIVHLAESMIGRATRNYRVSQQRRIPLIPQFNRKRERAA